MNRLKEETGAKKVFCSYPVLVDIVVGFILMFCGVGMVNATDYYVSTLGNDTWDGKSPTHTGEDNGPWKHPFYAAQQAVAGDTVNILEGTWNNEHVVFAHSGTVSNPIIMKAYDSSKKWTLDGEDKTGIGIYATDKSYIDISGIHIRNYEDGIYFENGMKNLVLSDFTIENTNRYGFRLIGDKSDNNRRVSNVSISNFNMYEIALQDASNDPALYGSYCDDVEVFDFDIGNVNSRGIDFRRCNRIHIHDGKVYNTDGGGAVRLAYSTNDSVIEHLWVNNTGTSNGIMINDPSRGIYGGPIGPPHYIKDVIVKNNVIYRDKNYSGFFSDWDGALENIQFIDNTFIEPQGETVNLLMADTKNAIIKGNKFVNPKYPDSYQIWVWDNLDTVIVEDLPDKTTRIRAKNAQAEVRFTDSRVFSEDGGDIPLYYPDKSSYLMINEVVTFTTYDMTAVPISDSATITVNKFNTSLPQEEILIDINVSTINGNKMDFNVFGLTLWSYYEIAKDSVTLTTCQANTNGKISFNNSQWTISNNITIKQIPDTFGPVISNVKISNVTETTVVISWTTDEPATDQVEYGKTTNYGSLTIESTEFVLIHSQQLTELKPGSIYRFRVRSRDNNNNFGLSENHIFINKGTGEVVVYPNPYIKGKSYSERISFGNLPGESTIKIYTISGKLVKTIGYNAVNNGSSQEWDISDMPSGIYIYTIIFPEGKKTGKVSIVK